jgi:hypothetical protein
MISLMKKIILKDKWNINDKEYKIKFPPYAWDRLYDIYLLDDMLSYNFRSSFDCFYFFKDRELKIIPKPDFKLIGNSILQIIIILTWSEGNAR